LHTHDFSTWWIKVLDGGQCCSPIRGGDSARAFRFNPCHFGLANSWFGLNLLQEPTLNFRPVWVLPGSGESLHPQHETVETHVHMVRGPFQPQDSDLLPLFEQDVLDETVAENPETEKKKGLPAVGARR
jgi:hypothetical protein